MEKNHFFLNAGIHPLEPNPSLSIPIQMQHNNDCFFPTWERSTDPGLHFDSALSSLVSSPAASNLHISNENISIRDIIAKLGDIRGGISPHSQQILAASYSTNLGNINTNITKLNLQQLMDQYNTEILNFPGLSKAQMGPGLDSSVAELMADPGFVERAARFSCFGLRSFSSELGYHVMGSSKVSRVLSSPLEAIGSQMGNNMGCDGAEQGNSSQEESTVSNHITNGGDVALKASSEMNSRERKAASKGKANDSPANALKDAEIKDNSDAKRRKPNQGSANENSSDKAEEDNSKPAEPPKDYIHVRARRGQATDSHSLAERVRREKISERMKLLRDLVPGCNKVTGKALMLDEIINYVQSLQRQVEVLSMKLASVSTRLDFDMDTFTSKDIFQANHQLPHPMLPLDSSASAIFDHQLLQNPVLHSNISNGILTQCSVDPLGTGLCQDPNLQLPQLDSFTPNAPQCSTFCEDDLQTIVQMGFGRTLNREMALQPQNLQGSNPHMKVEL